MNRYLKTPMVNTLYSQSQIRENIRRLTTLIEQLESFGSLTLEQQKALDEYKYSKMVWENNAYTLSLGDPVDSWRYTLRTR